MKRYSFIFLLALCSFVMFSCSKEEDLGYKEVEVGKLDDLEMFQNFIAEVDTTGKLVCRCYGTPLDPSDTTHLFIGVENIEEAEDIFLGWCVTEDNLSVTPSGILFSPTDEENNPEGNIFFDINYGGNGDIAEVTFSPGTDIKLVSKITFVKNDQWLSDEVHSPYLVGDFVRKGTEWCGERNWVCVREARPGIQGMLVYLSDETYTTDGYKHYDFPTRSMYSELSNLLRQDWDNYVTMFQEAGNRLGTYHYWSKERRIIFVSVERYTCVLRTGKIGCWQILWAGKPPKLQYGQVHTFGTVNQATAAKMRRLKTIRK